MKVVGTDLGPQSLHWWEGEFTPPQAPVGLSFRTCGSE